METFKLSRKDPTIRRICESLSYNGRKIHLEVEREVTLYGTYWDGGSRSSYSAHRIADGASIALPQYDPPQFGGPRIAPKLTIPEGVLIVRHSIFCGKDSGLAIFVRPDNVTPLLGGG